MKILYKFCTKCWNRRNVANIEHHSLYRNFNFLTNLWQALQQKLINKYRNFNKKYMVNVTLMSALLKLIGTISDRPFQTSLLNPQIFFFCIFMKNFTAITYIYNNSLENRIFLERETILCC